MHVSQWQVPFLLLKEVIPECAAFPVLNTGSPYYIIIVPKTLISLNCKMNLCILLENVILLASTPY